MLFGHFSYATLERDVLSLGGKTSGSQKSDSHEGFDKVLLLFVKKVILDLVEVKIKLSVFHDDFFECKWFFLFEDLNAGDKSGGVVQVGYDWVVLDGYVSTRVWNGVFNLRLWELKPSGGDVCLSELAHDPSVAKNREINKNWNQNNKVSKVIK